MAAGASPLTTNIVEEVSPKMFKFPGGARHPCRFLPGRKAQLVHRPPCQEVVLPRRCTSPVERGTHADSSPGGMDCWCITPLNQGEMLMLPRRCMSLVGWCIHTDNPGRYAQLARRSPTPRGSAPQEVQLPGGVERPC